MPKLSCNVHNVTIIISTHTHIHTRKYKKEGRKYKRNWFEFIVKLLRKLKTHKRILRARLLLSLKCKQSAAAAATAAAATTAAIIFRHLVEQNQKLC